MRISTRGVYALEAMLALGSLPTDERVSIRQISDSTGLSDSYLEQIFALLKKAGLLSSTRGNRGGYALGRAAQSITVGDIIRAAEGPLSPVVCVGDDDQPACDRYGICLSRTVWGKMETEINDFVDLIPLSDLIADFHLSDPGSDMEIYI